VQILLLYGVKMRFVI